MKDEKSTAAAETKPASQPNTAALVKAAMLEQAAHLHDEMRKLKQEDAGKDHLTFLQRPYAKSKHKLAVLKAPVWFTAYTPSIIGPEEDGEMMRPLETLCDLRLWQQFAELGIKAVHTGPVMKAGGAYLNGKSYPSIDGWFDPVAMQVDPVLGDERDYARLTWIAENIPDSAGKSLQGCVIGDIVPGHTGMGPDFHLALQGFEHYPGLFVLARVDGLFDGSDRRAKKLTADEIRSLRDATKYPGEQEFTRLLEEDEVAALVRAKVIPGSPQRRLGTQAGRGWSITKKIDGVPDESGCTERQWVYLHFFHPKQPTLNFLDPSYSAWRLVTGQLNYVVWQLRSTGVRLDANAFLGIEPWASQKPSAGTGAEVRQTWSESHPLSHTVTNMLAWQARRLGGFSFQEMNMTVDDIADSFSYGPDLAYDFITRPACEHALLTGSTKFLTFMFEEMQRLGVDTGALVHALQNHDEFTYELVHLKHLEECASAHGWPTYAETAEQVRADMRRVALNRQEEKGKSLNERVITSFYNQESGNGLCTTLPGMIAARLGCATLDEAYGRIRDIRKGHLLLAAFNALQPGVFAVSGWDLVGALPVSPDDLPVDLLNAGPTVKKPLEKDFRWINRGAFRLLRTFGSTGSSESKRYGCFDLPEAKALYGPMDEQSTQGNSFFSELKRIVALRNGLHIATSRFAGLVAGLPDGVIGIKVVLLTPPTAEEDHEEERALGGAVVLLNVQAPGSEPVKLDLGQVLGGWEWAEGLPLPFEVRDGRADEEIGAVCLTDDPAGGPAAGEQALGAWEWKLLYTRAVTAA